jgi:hypothetical protein
MEQLLAHLVGDYLFQPNQIAQLKLKYWWAAIVHGLLYTLPFLALTQSWKALVVISLSHMVIDRYRLAKYIGRLKNWSFTGDGYPDETPDYIRVWLLIITDNTMHLLINYAALRWLS